MEKKVIRTACFDITFLDITFYYTFFKSEDNVWSIFQKYSWRSQNETDT